MHSDHSGHRHSHQEPKGSAAAAAAPSLNRIAFSATLHCLTGCAIGEVLGMVIGTALGWGNAATIVLAVVLAFFFGYALTMLPLIRARLAIRAVLRLALAADTASITIMEIVDNAIMLIIPGAMDAGLDTALFWGSLAASLAIAGAAAFPVNRYLIQRGRGHAVVHRRRPVGGLQLQSSRPTDTRPSFRRGESSSTLPGTSTESWPGSTTSTKSSTYASSGPTRNTTGSTSGPFRTISESGCMAKRQMDIRPIRTDADYEWGLQEIERLMDAKAGSSDGDRLDVLATLVSAYEAEHFPMERPDPIAAIEFRMEQRGMTRKDLEKALGGKSRVSEILNRRRALTVSMIRKLSRSFDIPSDVLIGEYALRKAGGARKGSARGRGRRAG